MDFEHFSAGATQPDDDNDLVGDRDMVGKGSGSTFFSKKASQRRTKSASVSLTSSPTLSFN